MKKHILSFGLALSPLLAFAQVNATAECQAFDSVVRLESQDQKSGFQMDQISVRKNGQTMYLWADGAYQTDSLHSMWSASKTIGSTVVAAAIQKGDLKLSDKLKDFFPKKFKDAIQQERYDAITIENLINMSSGFLWDESYESDPVHSAFIEMIYGKNARNMGAFAMDQKLEIEPGQKWNYSGGNSNILMMILKKIYNNSTFPKDLLFKPLGLKKTFFETDSSGTPIASSYAYSTPEEMATLGELYLNDGVTHDGLRLLPKGWTQDAQKLAQPLLLDRFSNDEHYKKYIKSEGAFSRRTFWLNQDIPQLDFTREFPHSPADMYFAAGHYGQLIIVLPSQKMVIAATGHNTEYWSKIDKLVSHAVACFSPKSKITAGSTPPPEETSLGLGKKLGIITGVLGKGYLQAILAKEFCSCVYVSGLTLDQCKSHSNLPLTGFQLWATTTTRHNTVTETLKVRPTIFSSIITGFKYRVRYGQYLDEELGCRLAFSKDEAQQISGKNEDQEQLNNNGNGFQNIQLNDH